MTDLPWGHMAGTIRPSAPLSRPGPRASTSRYSGQDRAQVTSGGTWAHTFQEGAER